jgi:hypothetical protein
MILVLFPRTLGPSSGPRARAPPAHALGQQGPADLTATNLNAQPHRLSGQRVEGPFRRPGLVRRGEVTARLHRQSARCRLSDQADDLGAFRLEDPSLAALTAQVFQPSQAQAVEGSRRRTVLGLHLDSSAMPGTRCPGQLSSAIRARITRSRGALRARASRYTSCPSVSSQLAVPVTPPSSIRPPSSRTTSPPAHIPTESGMQH